jgi:hypothetical protein
MNADGLKRILRDEDEKYGTSKLMALEEAMEDLDFYCLREALDAYAAALWGEDIPPSTSIVVRNKHPRIHFITTTSKRQFTFHAKREVNAWLIAVTRAGGPTTKLMLDGWSNTEWNVALFLSPHGLLQSVYMLATQLFPIIPKERLLSIEEAKSYEYEDVAEFINSGKVDE